jgi:hypothetical protein
MINKPYEITIILPSTNRALAENFVETFLKFDHRNRFYPQFVILSNNKAAEFKKGEWIRYPDYEQISIFNDRYFGSCEENIYRVQDFSRCFKKYVICVGEHDELNWSLLANAIEFSERNDLEVCGLNILHKQKHQTLEFSSRIAVENCNHPSRANHYVEQLLDGIPMNISIGYPALLSMHGPVDWAAYIGNHIYRKAVFEAVISYRFSEYIYSLPFKLVEYTTDNPTTKYGFYNNPVINRVGDEFIRIKEASIETAWQEDHRQVSGGTEIFHIAILDHVVSLRNDHFKSILINSIMHSHSYDQNFEIYVNRHYSLVTMLYWGINSMRSQLHKGCFYFPEFRLKGALFEVRYAYRFICTFTSILNAYFSNEHKLAVMSQEICHMLFRYLKTPNHDDAPLELVVKAMEEIAAFLEPDLIDSMHFQSFDSYLQSPYLLSTG